MEQVLLLFQPKSGGGTIAPLHAPLVPTALTRGVFLEDLKLIRRGSLSDFCNDRY